MTNLNCGYCYDDTSDGPQNGSCLAVILDSHGDRDTSQSGYGRCQHGDIPGGLTWAYEYCPTDVAWTATFGLILYLMFFAPGG